MCPTAANARKCDIASSVTLCPAGTRALSGGWDLPLGDTPHQCGYDVSVAYSHPIRGGTAWAVAMSNNGTSAIHDAVGAKGFFRQRLSRGRGATS